MCKLYLIINFFLNLFIFEKENNEDGPSDNGDDMKTILFWTPFFDSTDYEFGFGQEPFIQAGCKVTNCLTTKDRSLLNKSSALIFHAFDYDERDLPDPKSRSTDQRYIFLNFETLAKDRDLLVFDKDATPANFFNWTMTYRRDSNIHNALPYGALKRIVNPPTDFPAKLNPDDKLPDPSSLLLNRKSNQKNGLIIWFYSKCKTHGLREEYFRQLSKYIPVDIYGGCGNRTCLPRDSPECKTLLDRYKFYLSAENSLCPDYITEKFYRALSTDVVPIVYGGADYSAYAPPNSFIHAGDFDSPKDLADYLLLLDRNEHLYSRYFEWKKEWEVVPHPTDGWCDLCEKLNAPVESYKSYENIAKWWYDVVPCFSGSQFMKYLKHY